MRVSAYVIGSRLPQQPFYIMAHGLTGAVDKVPSSIGQYLVDHRGAEIYYADSPLSVLSDSDLSTLIERGYVTDLNHEQEKLNMVRVSAALHSSDLTNSSPSFTFIPTYLCNLRCPYCFQSHEMHAGKGEFSAVISKELVDCAFGVIDRFCEPGSVASALGISSHDVSAQPRAAVHAPSAIGLFGGEPLSEVTHSIVAYILELSLRRGRPLSAITNGVQLGEFKSMLGPGKIEKLQITIDGLQELHDKRRTGPQFRSTFGTITDNVEMALGRGVRVELRVNVDEHNSTHVSELAEYFSNRGWNNNSLFSVHTAAITSNSSRATGYSHAVVASLTTAIRSNGHSFMNGYEVHARNLVSTCLGSGEYPFQRVAHCSAETGQLMFDPMGNIYSCWEEIGNKESRVATYDASGIHFAGKTLGDWLARFPGAIEQCAECPYALIHTSGCGLHAKANTGTIFASACESFQEYFPQTLADAYQEWEDLLLGREGTRVSAFGDAIKGFTPGNLIQISPSSVRNISSSAERI